MFFDHEEEDLTFFDLTSLNAKTPPEKLFELQANIEKRTCDNIFGTNETSSRNNAEEPAFVVNVSEDGEENERFFQIVPNTANIAIGGLRNSQAAGPSNYFPQIATKPKNVFPSFSQNVTEVRQYNTWKADSRSDKKKATFQPYSREKTSNSSSQAKKNTESILFDTKPLTSFSNWTVKKDAQSLGAPKNAFKPITINPISADNSFKMEITEISENQRKQNLFQLTPNQENDKNEGNCSPMKMSSAGNNGKWKPEVITITDGQTLVPVTQIPPRFRSVFAAYESFNVLQSLAFDTAFKTDKPIVVSAPTSSGKTVIFELAIIRLLMSLNAKQYSKILFMVSTKAVVNEKFRDWNKKFSNFGLKCLEVTGDSELEDYSEIEKASLIFTTPEKWDSLTRKAKEIAKVVDAIDLVLIDEIHCLNDNARGATLEVVISRMKTKSKRKLRKTRFIAVSATIPNATDIAQWIGTADMPSVICTLSSDRRPVKLQNIVLGYPCADSKNDFQFEKQLTFKVPDVISTHSDGKPTLIFVPTRASAEKTAQHIATCSVARTLCRSVNQTRELSFLSNQLGNKLLRDLVLRGIGFHHAGLSSVDRNSILEAFSDGRLMLLCCTTTLALGVNVPAHLVIVKATFVYINGQCIDLPESQVLQMIGRAGRPQFDTSAVAVIMTKEKLKTKYEKMLNGTQVIESSLHKHLVEHLNAEVVLGTISDVSVALEWLRSTFLYIRVMKHKAFYGVNESFNEIETEAKLQEWCIKELNALKKYEIIEMDPDGCEIKATAIGEIMARYCISLESMKKFMKIQGQESIKDLLQILSSCEEVTQEMKLRNTERTLLKKYNEPSKEVNKELIRYTLSGSIKTPEMKANILIQVMLGNLKVDDHCLYQDARRVMKSAQRVGKCLFEYLMVKAEKFPVLVNATVLYKCLCAGIWENSVYVTRQISLSGKDIGVVVSRDIVTGGFTSFEQLETALPPIIEMFSKKIAPFGKILLNAIKKIPRYEVTIEQTQTENTDESDYFVELRVKVSLTNMENVDKDYSSKHFCVLFIGNVENEILCKNRIYDRVLFKNRGVYDTTIDCRPSETSYKVMVNLISQNYVGIDVHRDFYPVFDTNKVSKYFICKRQNEVNKKITINTSIPTELKFIDNWQHVCSRDGPCHNIREGRVILARAKQPTLTVPSVKRNSGQIGPMDRFVDFRPPQNEKTEIVMDIDKQQNVVDNPEEEMESDSEFDLLLSQANFQI